jgi:hypothetical protein
VDTITKKRKQTVIKFSRYYSDIFPEGPKNIKKASNGIFDALADFPSGYVQNIINFTTDLL